MAANARQTNPLAAAAPARLEALFLPYPEVECLGNGKASAPVKASITTTNARAPAESRTLQLVANHWGEDWHFIVGADRFARW
jgi:hypothetical protein